MVYDFRDVKVHDWVSTFGERTLCLKGNFEGNLLSLTFTSILVWADKRPN